MLKHKNFFDNTTQTRTPLSYVNLISVRLKNTRHNFFHLTKFFVLIDMLIDVNAYITKT